MAESVESSPSVQQQSLASLMQRIGHIAGIITLAIVVFAALYFTTVFLISE